MRSKYPSLLKETIQDIAKVLREIVRLRESEDIGDFDNLTHTFMRGRKVEKVPASHSDTSTDDTEGDFNFSAAYLYIAVDDSGTLKWARVALNVAW